MDEIIEWKWTKKRSTSAEISHYARGLTGALLHTTVQEIKTVLLRGTTSPLARFCSLAVKVGQFSLLMD